MESVLRDHEASVYGSISKKSVFVNSGASEPSEFRGLGHRQCCQGCAGCLAGGEQLWIFEETTLGWGEGVGVEMPDGANPMQLPSQMGLTSDSQDWRGMIITKIHAFD